MLKGESKRKYQKEYMKKRRGSNTLAQIEGLSKGLTGREKVVRPYTKEEQLKRGKKCKA